MKIVYISNLPKTVGGPRYSVPQQVAAQSKYDDVYWINFNNHVPENIDIPCHIIDKPYRFSFEELIPPYNNPDLVIFEGFYYLEFCKVANDLVNKNIPYIIVPRSSLTENAQNVKSIKKTLANLFFFRKFAKNAVGIQYLTKREFADSGEKWNKNHIIIPNGVHIKKNTKKWDTINELKGIFIGRMDIFHKGLDLLIDALIELKQELLKNKCTIVLYGPDSNKGKETLITKIEESGLEKIVLIKDEVYGEDKEKVILESDFFILTSRFEGHPMALIEALSYGLPCLVTKGSNMSKEIELEDAGWTCATSKNGIVKAFKKLFSEKHIFKQKSNNAVNLSKQYNWEKLAKISHEKYKLLIREYNKNKYK